MFSVWLLAWTFSVAVCVLLEVYLDGLDGGRSATTAIDVVMLGCFGVEFEVMI